eukprot:CAMPEP_0170315094 /NCGR_PEP_ID=MMETSP0116_2-20130129/58134_1 /TAXON_ID=400756 /ORGANISM="Durinskia baltica, Strain CSIRO CS-38" /LENGTH=137 /DNA_ID=CAMNT_0010567571 /DNA_START=211 /DNA_END=622 /DNA_ORIENTATION=-
MVLRGFRNTFGRFVQRPLCLRLARRGGWGFQAKLQPRVWGPFPCERLGAARAPVPGWHAWRWPRGSGALVLSRALKGSLSSQGSISAVAQQAAGPPATIACAAVPRTIWAGPGVLRALRRSRSHPLMGSSGRQHQLL